jgi:RNA-binding protein YlmH
MCLTPWEHYIELLLLSPIRYESYGLFMREYLDNLARNEDEKRLIANLCELISRASQGVPGQSDFLDLRQQKLARAVTVNGESIEWNLDGGYDEAERQRLVVYPAWEDEADARIAYLKVSHKEFPGQSISHRDYLGAVLNLGLKREKLGDIVIPTNIAFLLVDGDIADFICQQLTRVKHSTVSAEIIARQDFVYQPPTLTTMRLNLTSLRLDVAIAAVFNLSRSQVDTFIKGGEARINHLQVSKSSAAIKLGDLISVQGLGRFRLEELGGLSRKGRQYVKICRW